MLALLQKFITLALLVASLAFGGWFARHGSLTAGFIAFFAFLLLALFFYAGALAIEFCLARAINARSACPVATGWQMWSAWWHEAVMGPMLFCWRQPFRANAVLDNLSPTPERPGQQGVVFIHGFFCNRAFWTPWMIALQNTGRVYEAMSLEPVFGSIDDYRQPIDHAVRRVTAATGMAPLLVCHSMGGLAARVWLAAQPVDGPSHHVVTIGTPHRGTWLARWGHSTNARQMQLGSNWLARLNDAQTALSRHQFTCWYSTADNIVFPSPTAILCGADNRELHGVAHVQMAFLPQVMDETLALLNNKTV